MTSITQQTPFRMQGTLTIRAKDAKTGRILRTIVKRNTITYDAGDIVRALLCQRATDPAASEYAWGSMRFGTGSTTPTRADTDLETPVVGAVKQLLDANKTDGVSGEITLSATLLAGDGNGNTFTEAAVFTAGAGAYDAAVGGSLQMFSRQVHAGLAKTIAIVLDYSWTFQFTT